MGLNRTEIAVELSMLQTIIVVRIQHFIHTKKVKSHVWENYFLFRPFLVSFSLTHVEDSDMDMFRLQSEYL